MPDSGPCPLIAAGLRERADRVIGARSARAANAASLTLRASHQPGRVTSGLRIVHCPGR